MAQTTEQYEEAGDMYVTEDFLAGALHSYTEALKKEPNNQILLAKRTGVYMRLGLFQYLAEDATLAVSLLRENDPFRFVIKTSICCCLAQLCEIEKAKEMLANLTAEFNALGPNERQKFAKHLTTARETIEERELDNQKLLSEPVPMEEDEYTKAGHKRMAEKNYTGAAQEFTKAIRKNPGRLELYFFRGEAYLHIHLHAHLAFCDTLEASGENLPPHFASKVLKLRAQSLILLRDFSETTISTLTSAIRANPKDAALPKLLVSACHKAATTPRQKKLTALGHDFPAKFPMPIVKNYSQEEEFLFLQGVNAKNPLVEIINIPNMGRGVVAKQDIKEGQVLRTERPVLAIDVRDNVCQNCFKELKKPQEICSGCGEEWYCSKVCQEQSWHQYHKGICKKGIKDLRKWVRDQSISSSGKTVLLALRCMGHIKSSDWWQLAQENPDFVGIPEMPDTRFLMNSSGHLVSLDAMNIGFSGIREYVGVTDPAYFNMGWYIFISNKCNLNSWTCGTTVQFPNCKGTNSTLYNTLSYFNHSCLPNAIMDEFLPIGVVKATKDIKKGEQVFIDYGNNPTMREALYGFTCKCMLCTIGFVAK